jgi:hypothetical protein
MLAHLRSAAAAALVLASLLAPPAAATPLYTYDPDGLVAEIFLPDAPQRGPDAFTAKILPSARPYQFSLFVGLFALQDTGRFDALMIEVSDREGFGSPGAIDVTPAYDGNGFATLFRTFRIAAGQSLFLNAAYDGITDGGLVLSFDAGPAAVPLAPALPVAAAGFGLLGLVARRCRRDCGASAS